MHIVECCDGERKKSQFHLCLDTKVTATNDCFHYELSVEDLFHLLKNCLG